MGWSPWSAVAVSSSVFVALVACVPAWNRWFCRRVWVPSSEEELRAAEGAMLQPLLKPHTHRGKPQRPSPVLLRHQYVTVLDGRLRVHAVVVTENPARARSGSAADDAKSAAAAHAAAAAAGAGAIPVTVNGAGGAAAAGTKPPLVLLHGFGGGVSLWVKNFAELTRHYTVYALDVPGFGRSMEVRELVYGGRDGPARAAAAGACHDAKGDAEAELLGAERADDAASYGLPTDAAAIAAASDAAAMEFRSAAEARAFFVSAIEQWRERTGLTHFTLLGHSLGGYIAADYALRHPERVSRLVLCSAFGFVVSPEAGGSLMRGKPLPWFVRVLLSLATRIGPMSLVRMFGPLGPPLLSLRARYDMSRYADVFVDPKDRRVADYVYHLIAQCTSGERAFVAISSGVGYAAEPLIDRVHELKAHGIPLTLIYGEHDLMTPESGADIQSRVGGAVYADLHVIPGQAHHPYATSAAAFHAAVLQRVSHARH